MQGMNYKIDGFLSVGRGVCACVWVSVCLFFLFCAFWIVKGGIDEKEVFEALSSFYLN